MKKSTIEKLFSQILYTCTLSNEYACGVGLLISLISEYIIGGHNIMPKFLKALRKLLNKHSFGELLISGTREELIMVRDQFQRQIDILSVIIDSQREKEASKDDG